MLEGLYSAAAGMAAQQTQLDAISNDLANLSTNGYKSERVAFSDLLYNKVDIAGTETTAGAGAKAQILGRAQSQGALKETGNPLDLAIEGPGYFQVTRSNGNAGADPQRRLPGRRGRLDLRCRRQPAVSADQGAQGRLGRTGADRLRRHRHGRRARSSARSSS